MRGRSKFWGPQRLVSNMLIDFGLNINAYRQRHNLSQAEMARISSKFGESRNIKFTATQISQYENMITAPRKERFQVLCNMLNMDPVKYQVLK